MIAVIGMAANGFAAKRPGRPLAATVEQFAAGELR
jgi:hypothetical protein